MRKNKWLRSLVSSALALSLAAGQAPLAVFAAETETEPNDSKGTATALTVGTTYSGAIADSKDTDWYSLNLTENGAVTLSFEHDTINSSSNYWRVILYASDATTELQSFYSNGEQAVYHAIPMGLSAGSYYVKVEPYGNNSYGVEYLLTANVDSETVWEQEQNNTKNTATPLALGSAISGTMLSEKDADWYCFTTEENGVLSASFTHDTFESFSHNWIIDIYAEDGTTQLMEFKSAGPSAVTNSPNLGLPAGTYYAKVSAAFTYHSEQEYQLTLNLTASDVTELENNDTKNTANALTLGTTQTGATISEDDVDWYSFTLESDGVLNQNVVHDTVESSSVYWLMEIYAADGTTCLMTTEITGDAASTDATPLGLSAGDYFLKIYTKPYSGGCTLDYNVTLAFEASDVWEKELNDSKNTANAMETETAYNGAIYNADDVDWYTFTLTEQDEYKVQFAHDSYEESYKCWTVTLYGEDGTTSLLTVDVENSAALVSSEAITLDAGTYYVKVTCGAFGWYCKTPYQLTVTAKEDYLKGDVNFSGEVDSDDAVLVLKEYAASMLGSTATLTEEQLVVADVDANSSVDSDDAVQILKYYTSAMLGDPHWEV